MIKERFAEFVTHRRGATLGIVALMLITSVVGLAVRGIPVDFSPQALFTTFEEQMDIDERFVEQFGSTENVALVIVRGPDVTSDEAVAYLHRLGLALRDRPFAERVESVTLSSIPRGGSPGELLVDSPIDGDSVDPAEADALRDALSRSTLFDGTLISADHDTAVVAVFLAPGFEPLAQLQPAINDIEALLTDLPPPSGITAEVGGLPYIRAYMVERFVSDQSVLIPLAALVCGLMLLLTFRWIPAVILPNIAVAFAGVLTIGAMAWLQEPFNIINQVVPTLIIVIGISDSIHVVSRYGEELRANTDRQAASKRAIATMAGACLLTSSTTAVGFGSLVISKTSILARFGVHAAIAVMLAYLMTVLFLPAALTWAKPPKHFAQHREGRIEAFAARLVGMVLGAPKVTLAISTVIAAAFVAIGSAVIIDTTLLEGFPESDRVHQQTRMLEAELNGVLPMEVSLSSSERGRFDDPEILNGVTRIQSWLGDQPEVLSTRSYGDLLHEAWSAFADDEAKLGEPFSNRAQVAQLASLLEGGRPDPMEPFVSSDRRHLRLNVQLRDDGSVAILALADELESRLEAELGSVEDLTIELTGDAYSGSLGLDSLIRDMSTSLGLAFLIIFGLMSLLFRSVRIGLISVPANMLPLVGTLAYMALRDIPLNTTTVVIFSVSIGLAVDDTIHFLARFREERSESKTMDEALLAAARGSGRAIIVTSIMLGAGMSVMLVSSFMPVRLFGELVCVTLVGCVFGDLLVLPAMLKLFAPRDRSKSSEG